MSFLIKTICAILVFASVCSSQNTSSRDFEVFPTGTYKLHEERATWGTAWQICRSEGAHLAVINSDTEAFIFSGLFARVPESFSDDCLLGFHDYFMEGTYVTVNDEILLSETGYFKWAQGEPNNLNGENCGSMNRAALLNDLNCSVKMVFICEK